MTDPLTPLLPVARVAAVGLVAAAGALVAVHAVAASAPVSTHTHPAPSTATVAKLVAIPINPRQDQRMLDPVTITDHAEITRVSDVINALPPAPTGIFNCPLDWGAELQLDFESADGTVVEQATLAASGCGGTRITLHDTRQPDRASGLDTIKHIESIIGTSWPFTPSPQH